MSPFYSLIGQNKGIAASGMDNTLSRSSSRWNNILEQQFRAQEAEKQREFQDEQRKKQESAAKKAFWTGKAVDLGTGIAGGAIVGGMAADMGGEVAAAGVPSATVPGIAGGTIPVGGAAAAPMSSIGSTAAPAFKPFAGGSVGKGALIGGALGGIGGVGGQNYLGAAMAMPGQDYARQMGAYNTINDNAMGWTNIGLNQARQTSNDAWRQKQYEETQAHNLEIEDDRARRTDAYSSWMNRQAESKAAPPKSTLKMQIGADGGRTLSGHPDEVTEWTGRNPTAIGSGPTANNTNPSMPVFAVAERIKYHLAQPGSNSDSAMNIAKESMKDGTITREQYDELMQYLLAGE